MSDFAGVWRLDGRPVEPADLSRLSQGLEGRGIGAARMWRDGPFALVHRQHIFTPEDRRERLPLVGGSGLVLVADLHLNDRDALCRALGQRGDEPDGALLLAALERWGVSEALQRVQGKYTFALWDPRERRLTLARDACGPNSLFLHRGPGLVAFSTRLRPLLALPDIPRDLDEQTVVDQMILDPQRPERTLYRAIDRVRLGHVAVVTAETTRITPHWEHPRLGTLRHASEGALLEEAQDVLDRVVGDALRAEGPVSLFLTGGLDSTAIAATAARLLAPAPLLALTRVPGGPLPPNTPTRYHDESARAQAMAARYANIDWHGIDEDGGDWGGAQAQRRFMEGAGPSRAPLNIAWFNPLYRFMAERGSRISLGGEMGNLYFSSTGANLPTELFLRLRWGAAWRHLRALGRHEGLGPLAQLKWMLRPLEPAAWRQRRLGRPPAPWMQHCALNPALAAELGLRQRLDLSRYRVRIGGGHRSTHEIRLWLRRDEASQEFAGVIRASSGMIHRAPLADRRVIEFFGALPLEVFLKDGVQRSLARRLLDGLAPTETVDSLARGKQNGDWFRLMTARRPALLAELERIRASPLARRVVDVNRLQALLDDWPTDAAAAEPRRSEYYVMLARGLEMGSFLAWHEGGNR